MEYREFRLIIEDRDHVTATRTRFDSTNDSSLTKFPDVAGLIAMDNLREKTINIFRHWLVNKYKTFNEYDEFVVLGLHLYEMLFSDIKIKKTTIRDEFEKELDDAMRRKANPPLRLVLEFKTEARDLAELPWEFLYCPRDKGYFLGACTELILARHTPDSMMLDDLMRTDLKRTSEQLKILLVTSNPSHDKIDPSKYVYNTLNKLGAEDMYKRLKVIKNASVEIMHQPTSNSLREKIDTKRPDVLHFIGHGQNGKLALVQEKKLALVQEKDKVLADWITDATFATYFATHQPRLVFLHACEGAMSTSYEMFKGMALKLMEARIPTVVAMQFEVQVDQASLFAQRFYEELSLGSSIDKAVQEGRIALGTVQNETGQQAYSNRAFGCPVIYVRNCTQEIVLVQAQEPSVQPQINNIDSYKCPRCREPLPGEANFCSNPQCLAGQLKRCAGKNCGRLAEVDRRCTWCGTVNTSSTGEKLATTGVQGVRSSLAPTPTTVDSPSQSSSTSDSVVFSEVSKPDRVSLKARR